jgi:hypothetical protein
VGDGREGDWEEWIGYVARREVGRGETAMEVCGKKRWEVVLSEVVRETREEKTRPE